MQKNVMMHSKKYSKPIVFMGAGPVAAASLKLLQEDFVIEAVITKPTTEKDMLATVEDTPVFVVPNRADLDDLIEQKKFSSTVGILIDFGIIISKKTIESFEKGIINSHFSLLPELRGADPISFAILDGRAVTGVSLMMVVEAMDEGPILAVGEQPISDTMTGSELTHSLIQLSNTLLRDVVPAYIDQEINPKSGVVPKPQPQEICCQLLRKEFKPTYTRKLTKADGTIDWQKSAVQLEREVRAFAEWPKSRARIGGIDCVITKASILEIPEKKEVGTLFIHNRKLAVACGEDALIIELIKPAGKKEMDSKAFLAGYRARLEI